MKDLLKKLKQNWLDYLVIFISVLAICFVYTFTAFYQPKEKEKTINEENIIKVLRDKKNAQQGTFKSEMSAFYIGTMSPYNTNNCFLEFYLNIESINISVYEQDFENVEMELEYYITVMAKYLSGVGMQTGATFNPSNKVTDVFYITNQSINNDVIFLENIRLYFNTRELVYENGYDPEDIYFDFGINYEIDIMFNNINDAENTVRFSNLYNSFGINASNLPVSVRQEINNNIFEDIEDVHENTSTRDFIIYFNTNYAGYYNGYNNGYNDGVIETEDYFEELIIPEIKEEYEEIGYNNGYNNGYNDGIVVGSEDFNILNFIRALFDLIWGVLNVEMLPNIKLIYIVSIPLVLSVVKFILGWFR